MRRIFLVVGLASFVLQLVAHANNLVIKPTTTLAQQTSNNTSAADSFNTQTNGNAGAGNISKVDIHSLLYPGNHTKIYAHLMAWFGGSDHMKVGYSSADRKQVAKQIQDMVSRGIDGVIIDWYGQGTTSDNATLQVMNEAELHPGFTFAIMVDTGAIKKHSCTGCNPQQALVKHLQYIEQTYFGSPAYMRIQGKPVITNFDIDLSFDIDWKAASATVTSGPLFIFQSNAGFTHAMSGGSYSWVKPTTQDYGSAYLTSFYKAGKSHSNLQTVGAAYKGFNDKLALWTLNRVMDQGCGQTWLQTFSKINSMYDSGNQLDALQLVTWNDYEEGTEIESGIDNCVSVTSSISKNALKWNTSGNENTIDHYRVYVSTDGKNLMPLTDVATGTSSLNLCSFSLASGNYQLFVQAVGKPVMLNQMSAPASYAPTCDAPATVAPPLNLQAKPSAVKIQRGRSVTTTVTVSTPSGSVATPVRFACSNLPVNMACTFSPVKVDAKSGSVSSVLSISSRAVATSLHPGKDRTRTFYACLFLLGVAGFVGIGQVNRKRAFHAVMTYAILAVSLLLASCGGMTGNRTGPTEQVGSNYTVTVIGTSGNVQVSTDVSVAVD